MFQMDLNQRSRSYYSVLGVDRSSSISQIRAAYRKLAMQWHPDKWTRTPSLAEEAKQRFQQIQEAYAVLSDHSKRTLYDAGLYEPNEEEVEGFSDFVQEMLSLMSQVKREEKSYSLGELQCMLMEMCGGPTWTGLEPSRSSKRPRYSTADVAPSDSLFHVSSKAQVHVSGYDMFGSAAY